MDMSKKVSFSMIVVLIVVMLTTSLALAADPAASAVARPGSRIGMVATIGKDQFTLKNVGGAEKKVLVNSTTRFVKFNGDEQRFKNLGVGQWVIAFGTINEHRELAAKIVLLGGSRINKGAWSGKRTYGRVISVDEKANTFRVNTQIGLMNFSVDTSTRYPSRVRSLHNLTAGMTVFLSYAQASGSAPIVKALIAIP
jgi:hypothetical protein